MDRACNKVVVDRAMQTIVFLTLDGYIRAVVCDKVRREKVQDSPGVRSLRLTSLPITLVQES
jgi:hypothetical protein